ncbi:hypothetical protein TNCV_2610351 [Trichonephila clavipes]|nr:hypothetical protein TNCV_2610351 [Trichonephila clavipes]
MVMAVNSLLRMSNRVATEDKPCREALSSHGKEMALAERNIVIDLLGKGGYFIEQLVKLLMGDIHRFKM